MDGHKSVLPRLQGEEQKEKEENLSIFLFSLGCGGRDSNSHRITPTTPSK